MRVLNAWPLIVALVSIVIMAATLQQKVTDHETRITRLENSYDKIQNDTDRLVAVLLDNKGR